MESSENSLQNKLIEFSKKNFLILGLLFVGLILIGVGLIQMTGQKQASIKFEKGAEVAGSSISKIKVDIEGEVINPGLYELNSDARVQDALVVAGGLTSNANRAAINLAAKIADGQKIYVPAQGETLTQTLGGSGDSGGSGGITSINSASQVELEKLSGIGPVTAAKIIDNRPYGAIEELLSRKIVGKATFEKIKDLITL